MWKILSNKPKEINKLLIAFLSLKKNGRKKKKCVNIFFSTIKYDESDNILSSIIIPFSFTENSYMNFLV